METAEKETPKDDAEVDAEENRERVVLVGLGQEELHANGVKRNTGERNRGGGGRRRKESEKEKKTKRKSKSEMETAERTTRRWTQKNTERKRA